MTKKGVIWYVGPTYGQAKETIWRDPEMLFKYTPREILAKRPNESDLVLNYTSGSVFVLKGVDNPQSLRGPNPMLVILDEVFLMKPAVWLEIIAPIAFANPEMEVWFVGTPKPEGKFWWDLFQNFTKRMQSGDKEYYTLLLDAEHSGVFTEHMLEAARSGMTQAGYEQEYLCKYQGEEGVVFRGIEEAIYGEYKEPIWDKREWGLDLAKLVDWTVLCGINSYSHKLDAIDRYNQIDYVLQKARIESYWRRNGEGRLKMDSTGVGEPIFDDLDKNGLTVEGIQFTERMKRDLVTNLAIGIEQKKLLLPNHPELREEFRMFGFEVSASGRVKYGAPDGYHDDIVMSTALAWWDIGTRLSATTSSIRNLLDNQNSNRRRRSSNDAGDVE